MSVLSSPLLKKWMVYVEDFNKKNPADLESWFLPLRGYYNNLDNIIDKAMQDPKTTAFAKLVEKEKLKEWFENWKYPPRNTFRFLHLDEAGENAFSNRKFELWVKYLDDWSKAVPLSEKTTMLDSIRANYINLHLIPILGAAEKVLSTKKLVLQLKDALADKWVTEKKTLDYVKLWLKDKPFSDDMLQRYTNKLKSA
ncbi:hypothetical protein P3T76_004273 [Phytophthora citrophthora]|uniref:RxLR effector protein n=1 Tax=Phytophthora citrophthora TaxID=4793 RepID=A0AAD9LQ65_9STRA|nr:hypothetical protein P3T76_004273 [Phytophthora citrophthora]